MAELFGDFERLVAASGPAAQDVWAVGLARADFSNPKVGEVLDGKGEGGLGGGVVS